MEEPVLKTSPIVRRCAKAWTLAISLSASLFMMGCAGLPSALTASSETAQGQATTVSAPPSAPVATASPVSSESSAAPAASTVGHAGVSQSAGATVGSPGGSQQNVAATAGPEQKPSATASGNGPSAAAPTASLTSLRVLTGAEDVDLGDSELERASFRRCSLGGADFSRAGDVGFEPAQNQAKDALISVETAIQLARAAGLRVAGHDAPRGARRAARRR